MVKSSGRDALVQEILSGRESVLQAIWAHQLIRRKGLKTVDGAALTVGFQGWLNREAGPDFRNARVRIGAREYYGDVEIHLDSRDWKSHGHHRDAEYGNVVLHVVLNAHPGARVTAPGISGEIPQIDLSSYIVSGLERILADADGLLNRYTDLPGRCGLRALASQEDALNTVIAHAAESRARQKAEDIAAEWEAETDEQLLYELIFQSLGYRPYAVLFRDLARRFPYRSLLSTLERPFSEARRDVLARWFGSLGLLAVERPVNEAVTIQTEYRAVRSRWLELGENSIRPPLKRGPSRPWNSPERRMVGLFHHLYSAGKEDWFTLWLKRLHYLDNLRDQPNFKREAMRVLEASFDTPGWEPWRNMVSFHSKPVQQSGQLIGRDRISIIVANAVIPFFLAYARRGKDRDLERLLYRLFIVLPPEAPNARTRFMEKRLLPLHPLPKNLRTQQGLLQMHQDFCTNYEQGCESCELPDIIKSAGLD